MKAKHLPKEMVEIKEGDEEEDEGDQEGGEFKTIQIQEDSDDDSSEEEEQIRETKSTSKSKIQQGDRKGPLVQEVEDENMPKEVMIEGGSDDSSESFNAEEDTVEPLLDGPVPIHQLPKHVLANFSTLLI